MMQGWELPFAEGQSPCLGPQKGSAAAPVWGREKTEHSKGDAPAIKN